MIESLAEEVPDAVRNSVRCEGHVAVGEQQDFPRGRFRSTLGRVILAELTGRQLLHMEHLEPFVLGAQTFSNLPGAVVGPVVYEDHFVVVVAESEQ